MKIPLRLCLGLILWFNRKAKGLAVRLCGGTHPKHFLPDDLETHWYLPHIQPHHEVVDLGCGAGTHALRVAARIDAEVIGIDYDRLALKQAQGMRDLLGIHNAVFWAWDPILDPLPIKDGCIDVVLCLDMLEHVWRPDVVLADIWRILRPGGLLLLSVPNEGTKWRRLLRWAGLDARSDPDHKREYTWHRVLADLAHHRFTPLWTTDSVLDMPLVGVLDVLGAFSTRFYAMTIRWRHAMAARYPTEQAGLYVVATKDA